MMPILPAAEPLTIVAGDTVSWTRALPDWPATDWTLHYAFAPLTGGQTQTIAAVADPDVSTRHKITLAAASTASWTAGQYRISAWVTTDADATARYSVAACSAIVTVLPDPSLATATDSRSAAQKMVEALEAAYAQLAGKTISATTIAGQTYTLRNLDELTRAISYWRARADSESGTGSRRVFIRF